jgi:SAM-dependent methyltransferase
MMRHMGQSRSNLLRQARMRYEHPLEVAAYAAQVAGGLTAEEETLWQRYVTRPCRILDVGCGAGREAIALLKQGHRVVATDISRSMLRAASQMAAEHQVQLPLVWMSDPLKLPAPNGAFDCVLALAQLLSHIPGRASRIGMLREMRRALTPGGLLIATVTDRQASADLLGDSDDADLAPLLQAAGWEEGDLWVWQPSEADLDTPLFFHLHTAQEIAEEIKASGLTLIDSVLGDELIADADADAGRYRYIVATKESVG